jgi:hypothetical protein
VIPKQIQDWCDENGWTEPMWVGASSWWWAFPPNGVMPAPLPRTQAKLPTPLEVRLEGSHLSEIQTDTSNFAINDVLIMSGMRFVARAINSPTSVTVERLPLSEEEQRSLESPDLLPYQWRLVEGVGAIAPSSRWRALLVSQQGSMGSEVGFASTPRTVPNSIFDAMRHFYTPNQPESSFEAMRSSIEALGMSMSELESAYRALTVDSPAISGLREAIARLQCFAGEVGDEVNIGGHPCRVVATYPDGQVAPARPFAQFRDILDEMIDPQEPSSLEEEAVANLSELLQDQIRPQVVALRIREFCEKRRLSAREVLALYRERKIKVSHGVLCEGKGFSKAKPASKVWKP